MFSAFQGAHVAVTSLWNGDPIDHRPVAFHISAPAGNTVQLDITGPLFNDPGPPPGAPGQACAQLWEYEGESWGVLPIVDYMGRLCPKGVHFFRQEVCEKRHLFQDICCI